MRCRECEALLWSYIDRELTDGERRAIDAHLATCPRCAVALERLRAFPLRPGRLAVATPPPDFTARLMRRIEPLPPPRDLALPLAAVGVFQGGIGVALAVASAAAALVLGLCSTAAMVFLTGHSLVGAAAGGRLPVNSIGLPAIQHLWATAEFWMLASWPVAAALCGMLVVLALLWFRAVTPHHRH